MASREPIGRLTGCQPVQTARVPTQHALAGGLGLEEAEFSVRHHLSERLSKHAPPVYGAHPMQLGDAYAVGAVHELGGRGNAERLPREGEHLAIAEQRDAVGEIEVDVLVDGGQIASLPGVRVTLV